MAVRVRKDGRVFCAALHPSVEEDIYIDDNIHYLLSVEAKVLVTDEDHLTHGEWWWRGKVPKGIVVGWFYES